MCRLARCPMCTKYRVLGCMDEEHVRATIGRVEEPQRCRCREKQMAAFNASAEAQVADRARTVGA